MPAFAGRFVKIVIKKAGMAALQHVKTAFGIIA
jgi:hypothetical protein